MSLSLSMAVQNATIALTNPALLRDELVVSLLGIPTNGAALMHLIVEFTGHVAGEAVHFRPESQYSAWCLLWAVYPLQLGMATNQGGFGSPFLITSTRSDVDIWNSRLVLMLGHVCERHPLEVILLQKWMYYL